MGNFTAGLNGYLRAQGLFFLKDFTSYVHDNWVPDFLQSLLTEMILPSSADRPESRPLSRFAGGIVDAFRESASRSC
jgi:hypothetical protein